MSTVIASAEQLVHEIWAAQVHNVGAANFRRIASDPDGARLRAAQAGGSDEALRFDLTVATNVLLAALGLAKAAIELLKSARESAGKDASRALDARTLDELIRQRVKGLPEEALVETVEYKRLIARLTQ